jgi:peptide/nickel transport system substrate-binding protein
MKRFAVFALFVVVAMIFSSCVAPTPQVVEKVVEKTVEVPVEKTVEVPVEKVVEKTVEVVVTPTTAPPTPTPEVKEGGTLNLWMELAPPNLYAPVATDRSQAMIFELIYDKLFVFDDKQNVVPEIGEKYEVSKDGLTYTISLRKDAKWHDGTPVTAKDIKFTIEAMCVKGSIYLANFKKLQGATDFNEGKATDISGVQIVDDYTLKLQLTEPDAGFLTYLVFWVAPAHIYQGKSVEEAQRLAWTPVGTGPYKFVQYKEDQFFEFDANADYFKGKPHIDKVFMKIAKADTALAMYEKNEIDYITDLPATEVERIRKLPNTTILEMPNTTWPWFWEFNIKKVPAFADKRVRQAFIYAMDRAAYVASVMGGHATVINHPFQMPGWAVPDPKDVNAYPYDKEKAKALLKEAGWDSNKVVTLLYYPGNKLRDQFAVIGQQYLKDVGVNVDVVAMDVARAVEKLYAGDWELVQSGGGATPNPGYQAIYFTCDNTHEKGGDNLGFYCNPKVDELFKQGNSVFTEAERGPVFKELAQVLNDDPPWLYLINPNYLSAVNTRIHDMHWNPNIGAERFLDIEKWQLAH